MMRKKDLSDLAVEIGEVAFGHLVPDVDVVVVVLVVVELVVVDLVVVVKLNFY